MGWIRSCLACVLVLAVVGVPTTGAASFDDVPLVGVDDAVVVAVIDTGFKPYHWDFLASKMPQHVDADPNNDLPLHAAPDTWLPGFPPPATFDSYRPLSLTLEESDPNASAPDLRAADAPLWSGLDGSDRDESHFYWLPGTKIIGLLNFGATDPAPAGNAHGAHTSAVAAGNIHGTCPECLLVLMPFSSYEQGEAAIDWAMSQPWIDVITNSYGFSLVSRDRFYSRSSTALQRTASERGQTIFFSAGNGQANMFTIPNTTLFSSQEGPDWIVTVGAVTPSGLGYTGSGKPVDIAAPGGGYPSLGGSNVNGNGTFSGTSNATPVVAGLYARGLARSRLLLDGPSRTQSSGVVATGHPVTCGPSRAACELGDGELTAAELRTRLLHGASPTGRGMAPSGIGVGVQTPETQLMTQGHGAYFGRLGPPASMPGVDELARFLGPLDGSADAPTRPSSEHGWFVADSWCRQHLWGSWSGGYWRTGDPLPIVDAMWPVRSLIVQACDRLFPPV